MWRYLVTALVVSILLYLGFVLYLFARGRREDARAWAGFIPDCIILFKRLLGDKQLGRRPRVVLLLLIGYLALPIDLVPDFIPIAGQADDAIFVALALRYALRFVPPSRLASHWPGPDSSLQVILRLAGRSNESSAEQGQAKRR